MSITGDVYVGEYEGHTIELVRNNWNETLKLLIDGKETASESRILPHTITLTGEFEHNGLRHSVLAKAVEGFLSSDNTVEIDGKELHLTKTR